MFLKSVYLRNFRNYEEAEISFSPLLNVIFGENAQGKTNLLEVIHLISTGRSFRTPHFHELIREGAPFFYLEAELERDGVSHQIKIHFDGQKKTLHLDANSYSHFQPLLGLLPSTLFIPADIDLVTGSPALRRRFLNLHLAQIDPLYVHHLTRYWRAMKQRNTLLRKKDEKAIDCWEEEMARAAAYLLQKRETFVLSLKGPLEKESQLLAENQELHEVKFHPSFQGNNLLPQLQKSRRREKELGATLFGPHRDDLSFWIGGKMARVFASEGQKKTALAALKLAEWTRAFEELREKPLFTIDDIGLPLDARRLKRLRNCLTELGQVFVTTPSPGSEFESAHLIQIGCGKRI